MHNKLKNWLLVVTIVIILIILDNYGYFNWLKKITGRWFNPLKHTLYLNEVTPVDKIELESAEKSLLVSELAQVKSENQRYRELLETPMPPNWRFWPAKIIKLSPVSMKIDLGKDQGVENKMMVIGLKRDQINNGVVIGRVEKTNLMSAEVQLLTTNELELNGVTSSLAKGVIKGDGESIEFQEVILADQLVENDLVLTEGKDGWLPGLVVGRVGQITKVDTAVFQKAKIKPILDIRQLEQVFVVALPL